MLSQKSDKLEQGKTEDGETVAFDALEQMKSRRPDVALQSNRTLLAPDAPRTLGALGSGQAANAAERTRQPGRTDQ